MTQALNFDRATRSFGHPPFAVPARPAAPARPLAMVPAPAAPMAVEDPKLEHMIRSIGQATTRMAELLEQLHEQQRIIAELQGSHGSLRGRAEAAEAAAKMHETRANEALLKVEQLHAEKQLSTGEYDRLKASVDTLLAMFGGEEQFLAAADLA